MLINVNFNCYKMEFALNSLGRGECYEMPSNAILSSLMLIFRCCEIHAERDFINTPIGELQ